MSNLTRKQRDILKAAHKAPQTEETLGADLVEVINLVGRGLLTASPAGFLITDDGARAIGKKPPKRAGALAAATAQNLDELVPVALGLIQEHRKTEATGDEVADRQAAMSMLLAFAVAVGILARIVGADAEAVMQAIQVGRKIRLHEGPTAPAAEA